MDTIGQGHLDFERVAGRTVVRTAYARNPLRFLTPRNHGRAAWAYTSSFGGGLVGGDAIGIQLRVREGAQAVLLSQSLNKVYRSDRESRQTIDADVERDALLAVVPDPVSCFAGSSYSQKQTYRLADRASLVLVDTLHCGREASGERWLFDRYRSEIRVFRNEKPIFFDSLLLDSTPGNIAQRSGRFNAFGLLLVIGVTVPQSVSSTRDTICAASALSTEGFILRVAGVSTEKVSAVLRSQMSFLPGLLGDDPWARKW